MRILVVEEERSMAGLRQGLEEEGHGVTLAGDGRHALEMAGAADFDLILLDVMLSGLNGFDVARRLRARKNPTPILLLTARDATADIVQGLNLGADDYFTKPFSFESSRLAAGLAQAQPVPSCPNPSKLSPPHGLLIGGICAISITHCVCWTVCRHRRHGKSGQSHGSFDQSPIPPAETVTSFD